MDWSARARWLADKGTPVAALILLTNIYFIRWRPISGFMSLALTVLALAALAGGVIPAQLRVPLLRWLGASALVIVLFGAVSPDVGLLTALHGAQLVLLTGAFVLSAWALLRNVSAERVLQWLFWAAVISAVLSCGWHFATGWGFGKRLIPLGRGNNAIPGAAALAAAGIAGLALWRAGILSLRIALPGILAIVVALLLTQSRGPFLGFLAAGLLVSKPTWRWRWWLPPLIFVTASLLVPLEGHLRTLLCSDETLYCRPSMREGLWEMTLPFITGHPLAGMGVTIRFSEGYQNNPQNGVLGTALYFGLPFLALSLWAWLWVLRSVPPVSVPASRWAQAMLAFSAVYYAFEPSPYSFYNTHYIFLWLPVALVLAQRVNANPKVLSLGGSTQPHLM